MANVLVQYGKHCDTFWPASTDEQLAKSALAILIDNASSYGWYCTPDELFPLDSKYTVTLEALVPGYADAADKEGREAAIIAYQEQIASIPDVDAQAVMKKKLGSAACNQKEKREYTKWYNAMREVVDNRDWRSNVTFKSGRTEPKSWYLLKQRGDYEYERVELEPLQEVDFV
jgi:hypothetical protein